MIILLRENIYEWVKYYAPIIILDRTTSALFGNLLEKYFKTFNKKLLLTAYSVSYL